MPSVHLSPQLPSLPPCPQIPHLFSLSYSVCWALLQVQGAQISPQNLHARGLCSSRRPAAQCLTLALRSGFQVDRARTSSLVPLPLVLFSQWLYLYMQYFVSRAESGYQSTSITPPRVSYCSMMSSSGTSILNWAAIPAPHNGVRQAREYCSRTR